MSGLGKRQDIAVLIVSPTRELAMQIDAEARQLMHFSSFKSQVHSQTCIKICISLGKVMLFCG